MYQTKQDLKHKASVGLYGDRMKEGENEWIDEDDKRVMSCGIVVDYVGSSALKAAK